MGKFLLPVIKGKIMAKFLLPVVKGKIMAKFLLPIIKGKIMPKQKTHKGTKKRFRLTASGKARHRSAGTSHLAARMSQKRKRNLRGTTTTAASSTKTIVKALAGNSY